METLKLPNVERTPEELISDCQQNALESLMAEVQSPRMSGEGWVLANHSQSMVIGNYTCSIHLLVEPLSEELEFPDEVACPNCLCALAFTPDDVEFIKIQPGLQIVTDVQGRIDCCGCQVPLVIVGGLGGWAAEIDKKAENDN